MTMRNFARTLTGITLLSGIASAFADGPGHDVRVAREWGAFKGMDTHEADGVKVKLAIEADVAPQWSSVLVYCLVEGADGKQFNRNLDHENVIGPVDLKIKMVGGLEEAEVLMQMESVESPGKANQLFVRSVALAEVGDYAISFLRRSDQKLLATTTIKSVEDAYHPWMPFGRSTGKQERKGDDFAFNSYAATRPDGIALPEFDGIHPLLSFGEKEFPAPKEPLPRAIPTEVDAGLKLSVEPRESGLVLDIKSDEQIVVGRIDHHLLMRWWVNGKPYLPKGGDEPIADRNGIKSFGNEQKMHIEFTPAHLGAKSGDKIGLQLLYVLNGWSFVSPEIEWLAEMFEGELNPLPRLSNKVEFTAP